MTEKINIDYEKNKVTVPLDSEENIVMLVSEGKVRYFEMADFGQFVAKTSNGKIVHWESTEKGRM